MVIIEDGDTIQVEHGLAWVHIHDRNSVTLDGVFTRAELREIVAVMETMEKESDGTRS